MTGINLAGPTGADPRSAGADPRSAGAGRPAIPTSMRAALLPRYGLQRLSTTREHPVPAPGPGQVLVRISAASINPADWYLATGVPFFVRLTDGLTRPKALVPGRDAAGVVAAVGHGVSDFAVGDRVFGTMLGAFAEYAVADVARIAAAPASVPLDEAAALPTAAVTALQAVDLATVEGRRVVINGASGGVGHYAVQLARAAGAADVIGVCSSRNRALVLDLGADRVVDYETDDVTDEPFDAYIDCIGSQPTSRVLGALADGGAWVLVGVAEQWGFLGPLPRLLELMVRTRLARRPCISFVADETSERLARVAALVDSGQLQVRIAGRRPLHDVADAYDRVESQRIAGKVVILP